MPTTRRPRRPVPATLRGLGVLLVLSGVVAMHQLAGSTHMTTMEGTAHAHAAAAHHAVLGTDRRAASGTPSMSGRPVVDAQAAGRSSSHGATPLCLAVLTGLALLALPTATPAARARPTGPPAAVGYDTSPPGRGPPRDLLAQPCLLRT